MNPGKLGRIFTILMIALIAYGLASALTLFIKPSFAIEIPDILPGEKKIDVIGNPDFEPVWLREHRVKIINNTTKSNMSQKMTRINRTYQGNNTT